MAKKLTNSKIKENEDTIKQLLKDFKKELNSLKNEQEILLIEENIQEQIKEE